MNFRMEIKVEGVMDGGLAAVRPVKERKKHDRFNGMSEEEVSRRTLPDHLAENLDIIIVSTIATHHFIISTVLLLVCSLPYWIYSTHSCEKVFKLSYNL